MTAKEQQQAEETHAEQTSLKRADSGCLRLAKTQPLWQVCKWWNKWTGKYANG